MSAVARPRQRGWWYPWIFVGFMVLVVGVNAVMATLAVSTFPGLQAEDAYNKGLRYNDSLAAGREQERRGWRMTLQLKPLPASGEGSRDAELTVAFVDREGQPLDRLEVEAALHRPTVAGFDRTLPLEPQGGGVYAGVVSLPFAGQWEARITGRRGADSHQTTQRLFLP
ncbi:MAG: FixH family protein [Rhodospirillales bacterium]|jgi:nitrogen fixation protein FixH|nr:FixH family protein [Rhodospirillales bacterium]